MSENLLTVKRIAVNLGLCNKYKEKWDKAESKKELIDISLDANGVEFLSDQLSFGWGLTAEYLYDTFSEFVNGKYIRNLDGYTSKLHVLDIGEIIADTTLVTLVSCHGRVLVPQNVVCKIYVAGNSNVEIDCKGKCYLTIYKGSKVSLKRDKGVEVLIKDKSDWIK